MPRSTPTGTIRVLFRKMKTGPVIGLLLEKIGSETDPMLCLAYTDTEGFISVNPYLIKDESEPCSQADYIPLKQKIESEGFDVFTLKIDRNEFQVGRIKKIEALKNKSGLSVDK